MHINNVSNQSKNIGTDKPHRFFEELINSISIPQLYSGKYFIFLTAEGFK
ncbi:hypothetical protein IEQ_05106 [Bacillus cereus BAG6X1-2]|nr:hypothetical protein IEQ_05106 [Bacillus cereus BAG6X1-2]